MGEEDREGDDPGLVHDQDAPEAGDQGGEEGDLRQVGDGQGQASQDCREGLCGRGAEEVGVSSATYFAQVWAFLQSPVGCPREAIEVLPCWFACGGAHVTRLYSSVDLRQHGGLTG